MMRVFAVRDVKADAFGALVVLPTVGLATRSFVDVLAQKGPMRQYPEDYMLYEIGEFDEASGTLKGHKLPVLVMTAVDALMHLRKEDEKQLTIKGMEEDDKMVTGGEQ